MNRYPIRCVLQHKPQYALHRSADAGLRVGPRLTYVRARGHQAIQARAGDVRKGEGCAGPPHALPLPLRTRLFVDALRQALAGLDPLVEVWGVLSCSAQ